MKRLTDGLFRELNPPPLPQKRLRGNTKEYTRGIWDYVPANGLFQRTFWRYLINSRAYFRYNNTLIEA